MYLHPSARISPVVALCATNLDLALPTNEREAYIYIESDPFSKRHQQRDLPSSRRTYAHFSSPLSPLSASLTDRPPLRDLSFVACWHAALRESKKVLESAFISSRSARII